MTDRGASDRGFALPVVLWALMLAGTVAATQGADSRHGVLAATARAEVAAARAAAEAGLALGLVRALDASRRGEPVAGRIACAFAGHGLAIEIEDEAGKVDLNKAPLALVESVLRAAAAPDELLRALSARRSDPRSEPFGSLVELAALPGAGELAWAELDRHLTVHGAARTDPARASDLVRAALAAGGRAAAPPPSAPGTVTLRVTAASGRGARYGAVAIVAVGRGAGYRPSVVERHRTEGGPAPGPDARPCGETPATAR